MSGALALVRRHRRHLAGAALAVAALTVLDIARQVEPTLAVPVPSTMVTDRHGAPLTEVPGDGSDDVHARMGYWPLPYVLPMRLSVATTETEDRRFFEHPGVSLRSVGRALQQNVTEGRVVSGASTIAMQVARLQSNRRRTIKAKVIEAIEALAIVDGYGHDAVLRQYLTLAPYGARVHGAERAARLYFDKPASDLSWLEAAWLAGLPQQPTRLSPYTPDGRRRGLARAHRTLRALHARGYVDDAELAASLATELVFVERRPRAEAALHFALRAADEVRAARRALPAGAAPIVRYATSLDLQAQERATAIVKKNVADARALGATNGAALALDAETGEVLAWVGSAGFNDDDAHGKIDYLTVKRSPGSTLKPLLFALALDPRATSVADAPLTAATPLADVPLSVVDARGRSYTPSNINRSFLGPMSARAALGNSRNIPALRVVADYVGVARALTFFEAAGVRGVKDDPEHYGLGLALGNLHVTGAELAALYLTLRHGGVPVPLRTTPTSNTEVDDALVDDGAARLLDRGAAELVTHILADPQARRPSFPDGSALDYDHAVAVKTGTSQGYRDGWTVAFDDRLLVVVWIGNHDWRRMNHLGGVAGTADAAKALMTSVAPRRAAHRPLPLSMPLPRDAVAHEVCALSGARATALCPHRHVEHFLPGTAPQAACAWHAEVSIDVRTGDLANDACPADVVRRARVLDTPPVFSRWARAQGLPTKPARQSRLCSGGRRGDDADATVAVTEPQDGVRLRSDPHTPAELQTVRLAADVAGSDDDVVFLIDGEPVALVAEPYETRQHFAPGRHTIQAVLRTSGKASAPVTVVVR